MNLKIGYSASSKKFKQKSLSY